jgi:hypothetical protein
MALTYRNKEGVRRAGGTTNALSLPGVEPSPHPGAGHRRNVRTDPTPEQGYFPLDQATVDGADAVLHLSA